MVKYNLFFKGAVQVARYGTQDKKESPYEGLADRSTADISYFAIANPSP